MYTKLITSATGCTQEDAPDVEALMRDEYGNLDSLSPTQFTRSAIECYKLVTYLKTDAGKAEWARMEAQVLGK